MVNLSVQKSVVAMLNRPLRDACPRKAHWQAQDVFQNRQLSRLTQQGWENFKDKGNLKQDPIQLPHPYPSAENYLVPATCPPLFESAFLGKKQARSFLPS